MTFLELIALCLIIAAAVVVVGWFVWIVGDVTKEIFKNEK